MNGEASLVGCLVERLSTRLPHRTGIQAQDLQHDEIVLATRTTLVKVSSKCYGLVIEALLRLLEDLGRSYKTAPVKPPLVIDSEIYILDAISDCCTAHWQTLRNGIKQQAAPQDWSAAHDLIPDPLDDMVVRRIFDVVGHLLDPVPDPFVLPAKTILEDYNTRSEGAELRTESLNIWAAPDQDSVNGTRRYSAEQASRVESSIKVIVEHVTASSWQASFDYFRSTIYNVRSAPPSQQASAPVVVSTDDELLALSMLKLLSSFWVDGQRLGIVIQEICSSFLHFRKSFQNTVAVVTPLLIMRWVERYPDEFVRLHTSHKRLDGGADTLFDMAQTVVENGRRKAILYPLQTTVLLLLPEVFEIAGNLREAKSINMSKKAAFLEGLRKALRNKNEAAAYCLVCLIRVARHFSAESDSALMSYALDVQDEIRDAFFRRIISVNDAVPFDQDLITAAFVSLSCLSFESSVETLAKLCLSPTAPTVYKNAVLLACCYFAGQSDVDKYQPLFLSVSGFIQGQMRALTPIGIDAHPNDLAHRRPTGAVALESLISNVLIFLDASPSTLFDGAPEDKLDREKFYEENFESFLICVVSANDSIRKLAARVARRLLQDETILGPLRESRRLESKTLKTDFWRVSSLILSTMCDRAATDSTTISLQNVHDYLESRLLVLNSIKELAVLTDEAPERAAASTKLETMFLVSLCSADIDTCQLVTACIGLFLDECRLVDTSSDTSKSPSSLARNGDIFREVSSRAFRFTGLVAFQKRTRGLLRRLQYPSAGILSAWELAFEKWLYLSKDVSTGSPESVDERILAEWRNYSGFLASIGGICTADQAAILEEPALSGLHWIDRLSSEHQEEPLLFRYLRLSIQLLACNNLRVREIMREVLSTEISAVLYQALFKALEAQLDVLFTGALETPLKGQESEINFAEQSSSLLKALVERLDTPSDLIAASSVHLGALTLNFAKFLDGAPDTSNSLRVKIKVCQLCEAVTKKKEHLNLRDDVRIRNQLLEYIFSWIARPRSPRVDMLSAGGGRIDEATRVQKDLDRACLKCLADLTFRLPLQPGDGQTDAGASDLKSQMFHTYFNRFLSLLNRESREGSTGDAMSPAGRDESTSMSELAISILSNLLSSNIDVGLKHSLSIGYHENVEIRTAFVKVLFNILVQGTEFSNLTDEAVSEKYEELLELLTNDLSLAVAMSSVCPSSEVDELTISLLNVFESRGMSFELFEALIKQEVEVTDNEAELLRGTSVATKMLSIYAKWKGAAYLKATLQNVVERLMLTSKDLDLELNPAKVTSQDELQKNALQLRTVARVFIDDICASSANIPAPFQKICSIISTAVMPKFPEAKYTAVGAFMFLRFFCPAIVAPEVEGLVAAPPSKEMRRGLTLIAKVTQNLANNVLFGAKEPYMFPLNDFLTQNIYRVTTFLREISVPPPALDRSPPLESFDFGSCVALHRYLYDHWDHVRQKLVSQERRDFIRSPGELVRHRSPVLEPLRSLITNLGPPPLAVSWNRPQISSNTPPAYARFQNFMLRNAFRSSESYITARAVYDGGESKDGLSIICIILRNIDAEAIDYDTLVYCYMKIASRLWHRPFGLLVDATCYNGQNEPQDDLFKKLELLTPTELSRQLSRIYIYNMNSAFRKCFRRVLRLSTRADNGVFNPKNVEYHLVGSLQDLQTHFHLGQLHLPKETISIMTDTRYVFQPVTRLSKTKGKIEVIIKVGSQFVQVTTTKKQEVYPGFRLQSTVNDIFRLGDIDEAPTSIQTDDELGFGLRADNGKIVMYFASPKKADVLQHIRGAKAKYGKDARAPKSFERLIRPQDVPGTLLNLALTNLASHDQTLRLASYNLLGALCRAFKFSAGSRLVCVKDVCVPLDPTQFIVNMSRTLAASEPQLTSDFLNEFFVGWDSFSDEQKPLSLAYMSPWLSGLRTSLLVSEVEGDKGREKVAIVFRKLIDVTISDPALNFPLEQSVWPAIYQDEVLLDIFLEELIKTALQMSFHDENLEVLGSVLSAFGTITLRGKVISRLRKALNRSSLRPTKSLPENAVWPEIGILLQFCVALSFDNGVQSQLYLPEIFHIVSMLANTGSTDTRVLIQKLLINSVHAACTSFNLDETKLSKLKGTLEYLSESRQDIFAISPLAFARDTASSTASQESGPSLSATENLATLLFEVCSVAAPSIDMANAWRARWMSLVASTAFQNNPAVQPRAFTVMGCLAREEVDDDLLYQVLVALRNSVGRFSEDNNSEMLVAIVTSLSKMMAKLPSASRYGMQLFWLAMSLLRLVPPSLFNCTALFLESVLTNIGTSGDIRGHGMAQHLLQGRVQLEEAALPLDDLYGVHFNAENFHLAVCATLVRGLSDTVTKGAALRVLSAFLDMTGWTSSTADKHAHDVSSSPYMALILARAVGQEELKDSLWLAGLSTSSVPGVRNRREILDLTAMKDKDLLLNTSIELIDFQYLEDSVQKGLLQWLGDLASERPAVITHLCGPILSILDDVLLHCQNSATLDSAHRLLQTITSHPRFANAFDVNTALNDVLDDMGFGGLWRSCSFNPELEPEKQCYVLTERLIELIII